MMKKDKLTFYKIKWIVRKEANNKKIIVDNQYLVGNMIDFINILMIIHIMLKK